GRPAAPHRPPVGGARLPRDLRRPGDGRADGHRQPAALRPRDGAVARHRRGGRRLPGHPDHVHVQQRARPAALRLRGRDHRRARVAVGHARGRRGARHRPDRGREAVAGVGDSHRAPGVPGRAAAPAPGPLHPAPENLLSPPMRPSALQIERTTRASRLGAVVATLALIALLSLPAWGGPSAMRMLVEFIALLVLAQMWNLLAGYAGLVSIGQQAYVGLGGYALIVLADDLGVDPFVSVPLAGLVAAALALPTAALVFRFHGGYFAVGTWAIAEVYRLLVANTAALGRGSGRTLKAVFPLARETREVTTYFLALAIGVATLLAVHALLRSRYGLGLMAIRDSEPGSETLGVDVFRIKLAVYVGVAFGTGVTGALIYLNLLRISPDAG